MSSNSMADIAGLLGAKNTNVVKNSTSRPGNTELNMQDFLNLMIVQLQNQTIDDSMDTSEMMNQMVQMQMISAVSNMTETNIMSYAGSLVGKVVTIGIVNGNDLEEREIVVMGTGVLNGQQVIFGSDGEAYALNQIMAIGRLPNEDGSYGPTQPGDTTKPGEGTGDSTTKPEEGDKPTEGTGGTEGELPGDRPTDNVDGTGGTTPDNSEGKGDTVDPPAPAE